MMETLAQKNRCLTQSTLTLVDTTADSIVDTLAGNAVTSVLTSGLTVIAESTSSGPGTQRSNAAFHQMGAAPRSPVIRLSAVKVGRFPCPHTVATVIAASSVITPTRTVRILVGSLTTPAHTPVSPCVMTCAGA